MEDELLNSFVHFRNLRDRGKGVDLDGFYTQIRKFIKKCKEEGKVELGWEICLIRFACSLDVIARLRIYLKVL